MKRIGRILIALFAVIGAAGWCLGMAPLCYWAVVMLGAGDGSGPSLATVLFGVAGVVLVLLLPLLAFVLMVLAALNYLKGGLRRFAYWYVLAVLIMAGVVLPAHQSMRYSWFVSLTRIILMAGAGLWGFGFRNREATPGTDCGRNVEQFDI